MYIIIRLYQHVTYMYVLYLSLLYTFISTFILSIRLYQHVTYLYIIIYVYINLYIIYTFISATAHYIQYECNYSQRNMINVTYVVNVTAWSTKVQLNLRQTYPPTVNQAGVRNQDYRAKYG